MNNMVKKFNKRQLLDQCGFTADETKIILDYQKRLPVLVENYNDDSFSVNARDLWIQLGEPQGKFADWIKRKLIARKTKEGVSIFTENRDYIGFSQNCEKPNGGRPSQEYSLTIDCSKNLSMMENTDAGSLARQYFILMEKAVKRNLEWELVRYPLREGYKKMQTSLDEYLMRTAQRNADSWDYSLEADALNIIATGFKAQEIRLYVKCKDNVTRDSLTITYNEYLSKLQELNTIYLGMDMNRYDRYKMLKQSFEILYPNAVPIRDDINIGKIIENKNAFLEKVKIKMMKTA